MRAAPHAGRRTSRRARGGGFVLLPVTLLLAVIAAAAWMASREGATGAVRVTRAGQSQLARYVAEAGLSHAEWLASAGAGACSGYALADTAFGAHTYRAAFTPSTGSPVDIAATGILADGTQSTVARSGVKVYEAVQTLVLRPDATDGKDAELRESSPGDNHGVADTLNISNHFAGSRTHGLAQFDLSALPAAAEVVSATLTLRQNLATSGGGRVAVHALSAAWAEGGGDGDPGAASWSERDAGVAWAAPGGDFDAAAVAAADVAAGFVGAVAFDVSTLVAQWVSGARPNHGVALVPAAADTDLFFDASDAVTVANRPALTIVYACECGNAPGDTMILQPGATGGRDAWIGNRLASEENSNNGAAQRVRVSSGARHGLLRFDLSALPTQAVVDSATLSLHLLQHEPGEMTVAAHRVTRAWIEGTRDGNGTPDGATWHTHDGAAAWASSGGEHDGTPSDTVVVNPVDGTRSEWDVTALAQDWVGDPSANHGVLLRYASGTSLDHFFASSDHPIASTHPRLTVTYRCPCGVACPAGGFAASFGTRALLVVDDDTALTPTEAEKRTLIESFGFTTSVIDSGAPAADFRAAALSNDVVFVGEDVLSADLGTKLTGTHLGVVNEEPALSDELALWSAYTTGTASALDIVDDTHYVTQDFATGPLTLFTSAQPVASASGTVAPGVQALGRLSGVTALAALDKLAEPTGGGAAAGRRVQLPWIGDYAPSAMTTGAQTLLRRALEWAATPPDPTTAAYLDGFETVTCVAATDYAGSDGRLDWSGTPWAEVGDTGGDPCAGDVKIVSDGGGQRLSFTGFDKGAQRVVAIPGASWATLSFVYRRESLDDAGEWVAVEVSPDGGASWTEVHRIEGPGTDTEYQALALDIAPLAGPLTMVRLRANGMSPGGGSPDAVYVDDVRVETDSAGGGSCTAVLADDFQTGGFAGSSGGAAWSGPWSEIGESDGAPAGNVTVGAFGGTTALGVESKDRGAWRGADLSAYATAVLSYAWRRDSLESPDFLTVEISGNGGASWTQLEQLAGAATDTAWQTSFFDVSAYLGSDLRIRFLSNDKMGGGDFAWFDDVSVCLN